LLALVGAASSAIARDTSDFFRPIRAGEPVTIRSDKAYLLIRIGLLGTTQDPVILREPDASESATYEAAKAAAFARKGSKGDIASFAFDYDGPPNLFIVSHGKSIARDKAEAMVLAEVRPGSYVLYGQGYGYVLYQCHCLGTVGFTAVPGVVTDLGTYLSDNASKPSVYPELAGETNIGPTARMDFVLFAGGLVPAAANAALPPGVDRAAVKPAAFHAVGPFVDPNVMQIDRLAAIPGVLSYDGGRVIDVASGKEAPPR
jgi:hypothetical protein